MQTFLASIANGTRNGIKNFAKLFLSPKQADRILENLRFVKALPIIRGQKLLNRRKNTNFELPEQAFANLRVALIADEFSRAHLEGEFKVHNLIRGNSIAQLELHRPQVLIVESAWNGPENSWRGRLVSRDIELRRIIKWCRENDVPTVFWNKEDPIHWKSYILTASLFDFVFTTDASSVNRYQKVLASPVAVMPFFVSTKLVNPFEETKRQKKAFFAGSFYAQYMQRKIDTIEVITGVSEIIPVDIFDRNLSPGKPNPHPFPEELGEKVHFSLPFNQVLECYKKYFACITINTVKKSPTMMARRAIEAALSNTLVISNENMTLRSFFDSSMVIGDVQSQISSELVECLQNPFLLQTKKIDALIRVLEGFIAREILESMLELIFQTSGRNTKRGSSDLDLSFYHGTPKKIKSTSLKYKNDIEDLVGTSEETVLPEKIVALCQLLFRHYETLAELTLILVNKDGSTYELTSVFNGSGRNSRKLISFA